MEPTLSRRLVGSWLLVWHGGSLHRPPAVGVAFLCCGGGTGPDRPSGSAQHAQSGARSPHWGPPCQGFSALFAAAQHPGHFDGRWQPVPREQLPQLEAEKFGGSAQPAATRAQTFARWVCWPPWVCFLGACGVPGECGQHDQRGSWSLQPMDGQLTNVCWRSCLWVGATPKSVLVGRKEGPAACWDYPASPWTWSPTAADEVPTLVYEGAKPCPPRVFFQQDFQPMFDPADVVAKHGVGAFHTFTREFRHPADGVAQVSAAAAARFEEDCRRPPAAYEERSLLWSGRQWRQPLREERAQMHGLPAACLGTVAGDPDLKRQRQNSRLGNGFHMFSLLFSMLPSVLGAKVLLNPPCLMERGLQSRLVHSVWEPGRLASMPGLLTAGEVIERMQPLLPACSLDRAVWEQTTQRLQACNLQDLQMFAAWCRLRGEQTDVLGPQPLLAQDRAQVYAGLSGQRYAADTTRGLNPLLPPGLGKEGHMEASAKLGSPFAPRPWPELDIAFVVDAIAIWQWALPRVAEKLRHVLRTVARALHPLELAIAPFRVPSAQMVAAEKKPAFVAFMTVLLHWPDLRQAHLISYAATPLWVRSAPVVFFDQWMPRFLILSKTGSPGPRPLWTLFCILGLPNTMRPSWRQPRLNRQRTLAPSFWRDLKLMQCSIISLGDHWKGFWFRPMAKLEWLTIVAKPSTMLILLCMRRSTRWASTLWPRSQQISVVAWIFASHRIPVAAWSGSGWLWVPTTYRMRAEGSLLAPSTSDSRWSRSWQLILWPTALHPNLVCDWSLVWWGPRPRHPKVLWRPPTGTTWAPPSIPGTLSQQVLFVCSRSIPPALKFCGSWMPA